MQQKKILLVPVCHVLVSSLIQSPFNAVRMNGKEGLFDDEIPSFQKILPKKKLYFNKGLTACDSNYAALTAVEKKEVALRRASLRIMSFH